MSYKFDSIVNRNEAAALKEMIFKRAQERAQVMSEDTQSDVMDMARDSFVSKDNPFSKIIENTKPSVVEPEKVQPAKVEPEQKNEEIGFPMPEARLQQNKIINI